MAITLDGTDGITTTGLTSSGIDDNATSTAVTINASQNVGIGTANPSSKLEVVSGASHGTGLTQTRSGHPSFSLLSGGTNSVYFGIAPDGGSYNTFMQVTEDGTDIDNIRFSTGASTERMRIDSSGNLLVGATSAFNNHKLFVQGTSSESAATFYRPSGSTGGANVVFASAVSGANTVHCIIRNDGDLENTNNTYGGISDERLKSNIVDANPQLDDIMAVQVRSYTLDSTGATHIGVVAQELEAAGMSGLVKEDEDGTKSVKYSILYMKAIKALQEAVATIEELKARVAALEAN